MSVSTDGWDSTFGGTAPAGELPIPGSDRMGVALRSLVQSAMGMPANSVRPENQKAGAGRAGDEFATVKIVSQDDMQQPESTLVPVGDGTYNEQIAMMRRLTVSVNFYKVPNTDAAGLPRYSTAAYDRAVRLTTRLRMALFAQMAWDMGFGYMGSSPARDLTGIQDGDHESRGQVDLYFSIQALETTPIGTFSQLGEVDISVESPDGSIHTITEVTP